MSMPIGAEGARARLLKAGTPETWMLVPGRGGESYLFLGFPGGVSLRVLYAASPCRTPRRKEACGSEFSFCAPFEPGGDGVSPSGCRSFRSCWEKASVVERFPDEVEAAIRAAMVRR